MMYSSLGFYVINAIVFAVALRFWFRTRHIGFAWVSAAYGLTVVSPFLTQYIFKMLRQFGSSFFNVIWFLVIPTASAILIILGLRSFAFSIGPPPEMLPNFDRPNPRPPIPWSEVKRRGFGAIGVGLILGGILTIIRGVNFMLSPGGEVADLGAGPGAIVVGAMCVALAFHPRSPLNTTDSEK
jgi:hypothetical protein